MGNNPYGTYMQASRENYIRIRQCRTQSRAGRDPVPVDPGGEEAETKIQKREKTVLFISSRIPSPGSHRIQICSTAG